MCVACNAPFWLLPKRSAAEELAFQQARLHSATECQRCQELQLEVEQLERELRAVEEYYERDDPEERAP